MTICNEISAKKLNICLLNETWHSTSNDNDALLVHGIPRPQAHGNTNHGGVAAIVLNYLKYRDVKPRSYQQLLNRCVSQSAVDHPRL